MKKAILILLILTINLVSTQVYAQNAVRDSLENLLKQHVKKDTARVNLLTEIAYEQDDLDTLLLYAQEAQKLSEKLNFIKGKIVSKHLVGIYYQFTDSLPKALTYFKKSMELSKEINNSETLANSLLSIAQVYLYQSNYHVSLDYHYQTLKIAIKNNYMSLISSCYNNIGLIYQELYQHSKAREFYEKALKIDEQLCDSSGIAHILNNIGTIYFEQSSYEKARVNYMKALKISEKIGSQYVIAIELGNVGTVYYKLGENTEALEFLEKSLSYGNRNADCKSYYYIAAVKLKQKKQSEALKFTLKSLKIAKEMELITYQKDAYEQLAEIYQETNNYKKAYENYKQYKTLNDSIFNESNVRKLTSLENKYKFDKEKQIIQLEQQKKDKLFQQEVKLQKAIRNLFIVGFAFMIMLLLIVYYSLLQKRRANKILAEQKEEIAAQANQVDLLNSKLMDLGKFKMKTTSMLVHDLKNPINSVLQLSKNKKIIQAAYVMQKIILNILDVSKAESSQLVLKKNDFSLRKIFETAALRVALLAENKNLLFVNNCQVNLSVHVDFDLVVRVFENLLANAIKFSPQNDKITLAAKKNKGNFVEISIADNGRGVSIKYINFIFEQYKQALPQKSGNIKSTGLGLSFCKIAVEAHKGKIHAESDLGEGFKIVFTLPSSDKTIIFSEKEKVSIKNKLSLHEKRKLIALATQFKKIEIYEASKIMELLKNIETDDGENTKIWSANIKQAVFNGNNERYLELLKIKN